MKGGEATTVEVAEYGPTERVTRRPRLRRGGAIAGPVGTFLALPAAALISPFVPDYAQTYHVACRPTYHDGDASRAEDREEKRPA